MTPALSVLSDAPVGWDGDRLDFARYVDPLVEIITNDATQTPFTVGIFGAWGSGKTSVLEMIGERLEKDHPNTILPVRFNPWVHRRESTMLLPLLHTLQDTLKDDPDERFADNARRIGSIVTKLSTNILLGRLSGGAVTLEKIKEHSEKYAEQRGEVESAIRKLRGTLTSVTKDIREKGARLVVFVDDLDRCEPDEMVDLLESIKLFLDLPNVFFVLAIAKDVVDRGIAYKYRDFNFGAADVLAVGDEYLDKMIQLPLYLLPIDAGGAGAFMRRLSLPDAVRDQIDLLQTIVSPNPRRIKRVLNMCAVTYAILERTEGLKDLRQDHIARLAVLRIESGELYKAITVRPQLLVALELAYQSKLSLKSTKGFVDKWGTREAAAMQGAAENFYGSKEFLKPLFKESSFADMTDDLPRYLTMLGSRP